MIIIRLLSGLFLYPKNWLQNSNDSWLHFRLYFGFYVLILLVVFIFSWLSNIPLILFNIQLDKLTQFGFLYQLYPWSSLLSIPVFWFFYTFFPSNTQTNWQIDFRIAFYTALIGIILYFFFILVFTIPVFSHQAFNWNYNLMLVTIAFFQVRFFFCSLSSVPGIGSVFFIILMNVIMNFLSLSLTKATISLFL